uniref:Uncharacterized protein n=1 Tax=Alexandrium catenella TaxID=2925 RepID=A0A7S1RZC7_ALECA
MAQASRSALGPPAPRLRAPRLRSPTANRAMAGALPWRSAALALAAILLVPLSAGADAGAPCSPQSRLPCAASEDEGLDEIADDTSFLQTYTVVHRGRGKRQDAPERPVVHLANHEEAFDDVVSF